MGSQSLDFLIALDKETPCCMRDTTSHPSKNDRSEVQSDVSVLY